MARGSKASYTNKQKRMASHIESSEKKSGKGTKSAERIAWATVNKETGGGKKKKAKSSKKASTKKAASKKKSKARKKTGAKKSTKRS